MADGSIIFDTALDTKKLNAQVSKLKTNLKAGFEKVGKAASIGLAGITAGIGAVATASVKISETTDRIDKMSQKIGMSRESFQEWDFILSQNGASVDGLQTSMKTLSAAADDVATGGKTYTEQFKKLGVSVKDVNGNMKDQETLFNEVFLALGDVKDETTRTAIASDLLGKSATELAPALNVGSEAIEEQRQKAHDLGLVLGDDTVDAGVKLTDTMDQLKRAGTAAITGFLTPAIEPVNDLLQSFIDLSQGVSGAKESLVTSVSNMVTKTIDLFIEMLPTIINVGIGIVKSLIIGLVKSIPAIVESVGYLIGYLVGTITKNKDKILETGKDILLWIVDGITNVLGKIGEVAGKLVAKFVDFITTSKDGENSGVALLESVANGILSAIKKIADVAIDVVESFIKGLTGKDVDIKETGKEILTNFVDAIKETINDVKDLGKFIVDGFINGIKNAKDKVVQGAKDMGNAFLGGVKDLMGIHSPSKVMAEIGDNVVTGYTNGVADAQGDVTASAKDLVDNFISPIEGSTKDAEDAGKDIGNSVGDGIVTGEEESSGEVEKTTKDIIGEIQGYVTDALDILSSAIISFNEETVAKLGETVSKIGESTKNAAVIAAGAIISTVSNIISFFKKIKDADVTHERAMTTISQDAQKQRLENLQENLDAEYDATVKAIDAKLQKELEANGLAEKSAKETLEAKLEALKSSGESEYEQITANIDKKLQAELEANGLAEKSAKELLEEKLTAAKKANDAEEVAELTKQIKKQAIIDKYAKAQADAKVQEEKDRKEQEEAELKSAIKKQEIADKYAKKKAEAEEKYQKASAKIAYDKAVIEKKIAIAQAKIAREKAISDLGWFNKGKKNDVRSMYGELISSIEATPLPSYDVGGVINQDQLANIHRGEIIIPAGLSADAQKNGLTIAPMNSGQNQSFTGIINVDGRKLAKVVFNHSDTTVGLAY